MKYVTLIYNNKCHMRWLKMHGFKSFVCWSQDSVPCYHSILNYFVIMFYYLQQVSPIFHLILNLLWETVIRQSELAAVARVAPCKCQVKGKIVIEDNPLWQQIILTQQIFVLFSILHKKIIFSCLSIENLENLASVEYEYKSFWNF